MLAWKGEARKKGRKKEGGRRKEEGGRAQEEKKEEKGRRSNRQPTQGGPKLALRQRRQSTPGHGEKEKEERKRRRSSDGGPSGGDGRSPGARVEVPERKERGEARRAAGGCPSEGRKGDARRAAGWRPERRRWRKREEGDLEKKEGRRRRPEIKPSADPRRATFAVRTARQRLRPTKEVGEKGEPRRCDEENVEPAEPQGPSETRRWSDARAEKKLP